jgi:WD40 repeat protein
VNPTTGQVLAAGADPLVSWYDAKTGERARRSGGPATAAHEIAIDAQGALVAVAGADGTVRTLNPATAAQVRAVQTGAPVFAVALDSGAKRLASGGTDGTVKLWDAGEARLLLTLWAGPNDSWLAFAPEGYFAGSDALLAQGAWRATGKPVEAKWLAPLRDSAQLSGAARGKKLPEPVWK